ncbi:hypothetical protein L6Q96_22300 [Candidatus Binatia bacterium]|nr:hypothetical protein [Candidatus Binatia bacterium]
MNDRHAGNGDGLEEQPGRLEARGAVRVQVAGGWVAAATAAGREDRYFVVDRWRDREVQLAQTSDQLARATDLISRYVATQVAQQILAGNYGAVDRHERRGAVSPAQGCDGTDHRDCRCTLRG